MPNNAPDYGGGPSVKTPLSAPVAATDPARLADTARRARFCATIGGDLAVTVTYSSSGGGGLGTLTATSNGAFPTINGVTVPVGTLLFLLDSGTGANGGLYTLTNAGSGGAPFVLTRRADWAHGATIPSGTLVSFATTSEGDGPQTMQLFADVVVGTDAPLPVWVNGIRNPLFDALECAGRDVRDAVLGGGNTDTTFAGASLVPLQSESGNFNVDRHKVAYELTGTGQVISLGAMITGQEMSFWDSTGGSPTHTFDGGGGTDILFAGSGASPGQTASWPSGATVVVIHRKSSTVFLRS